MLNPKSSRNHIDRKRLSDAGFHTFLNIAGLWRLSVHEQITLLGLNSKSKFYNLKNDPNPILSDDTLERISYILGIYKALQILLPDTSASDQWVKRPNFSPLFGGKSALDKMMSGNVSDIAIVRQHLDAQRGGWA